MGGAGEVDEEEAGRYRWEGEGVLSFYFVWTYWHTWDVMSIRVWLGACYASFTNSVSDFCVRFES